MAETPYQTAYVRPNYAPGGRFIGFHVAPTPFHTQNGYWRFTNEGVDDVRAFNLGYQNPEQILNAAANEDVDAVNNYEDIMLSWIPGQMEPYQTSRIGSATSHITAIVAEKSYLSNSVSFRGSVPFYPVDSERKLLAFRERFNIYARPPAITDIPVLPRSTASSPVRSSSYQNDPLRTRSSVYATPAHNASAPTTRLGKERVASQQGPYHSYKQNTLERAPIKYAQTGIESLPESSHTPTQGPGSSEQIALLRKAFEESELDQLRRLPAIERSRGSANRFPSPDENRPYVSPYASMPGSRDVSRTGSPIPQATKATSFARESSKLEPRHVEIMQTSEGLCNQGKENAANKGHKANVADETGSSTEPAAVNQDEEFFLSDTSVLDDFSMIAEAESSTGMMVSGQASVFQEKSVSKGTSTSQGDDTLTQDTQGNENVRSKDTVQGTAQLQIRSLAQRQPEATPPMETIRKPPGCPPEIKLSDIPGRPVTNGYGEVIDVSDNPFYQVDDEFTTNVVPLSELVPCFICAGVDEHAADCLVTSFMQMNPPTTGELRAIADVTEQIDPNESRTTHGMRYGLAHYPSETDEVEANIPSFAEIIKNEESYKKDENLQALDLPDEQLVLLWALRQSKNSHALIMLPDGEFECPPGFEHLWEDEEEDGDGIEGKGAASSTGEETTTNTSNKVMLSTGEDCPF